MKTCIVRKRMEPKASGSYNFDIQTPIGFGIPKCGICLYTNGTDNDAFDESSLDRVFGIGFFGYSYANPATFTGYTSSIGFTHNQSVTSTIRKASSGTIVTNRIAYELKADRTVIRQCNFNSVSQDKITVNLVWSNPATSYLDLIFVIFSGDDIQANIGLLNLGTALNSTASATGLSYSPDVVFTLGSGFGFSNSDADARMTFGCATKYGGIKNSAAFYRMRSNANGVAGIVTSVEQYFSDNRCFIMYGGSAGANTLQTADVTSFNSDGFTITSKTTVSTGTTGILYLAIKGPIEDAFQLQNFTSSTSTGISAIATTTWIPSLIVGALGSATAANSLVSSNDSTGFTTFAVKSLSSKNNYGAGTISVSSGTTSVSGSGTGFSRFNVGDVILSSTNSEVGVVSEVVNSTSLFVKQNSPITLSSDNFSSRPFDQFSVTIGSSHLSSPTKIASSVSESAIKIVKYGVTAGISTVVKGVVNNFNSYPGLRIDYNTVDATARKGWFLAVKDTELRRRDSN
jgi:hypothetical protein